MKTRERLFFPDLWRAFAVIAMIGFHTLFLGWFLYHWPILVTSGPLRWLGWLAGGSFLFLAGWSAWLRQSGEERFRQHHFEQAWEHCAHLGFWAFIITSVTMVVIPQAPVWWGILHCLAVSLLVAHILLAIRMRWLAVFTGFTAIVVGLFMPKEVGSIWTLPVGFPPTGFSSIDYYPLLPFGGIVLLSAGLGPFLTRLTAGMEPTLAVNWPGKAVFLWIGRHSLFVYLVHVPIIAGLLWLWHQV